MTNWALIGPAPLTSLFDEQADATDSTGFLEIDKNANGDTWIEYSASWPETTNRLRIGIDDIAVNREGGFDIGIGGAGSERAIFTLPGVDYTERDVSGLELPITIRAGERVAVRVEGAASGVSVLLSLTGYYDPLFRTDFRYVDVIGKVTQELLTAPDPGTSLNTKGVWSQIIASTANNYKGILLVFGNSGNANTTNVQGLFDIGIGASSSEVVVISDIWVKRRGRSVFRPTRQFFISAHIPAGVRLAVRCQADNVDAGVRDLTGVAVIGFY